MDCVVNQIGLENELLKFIISATAPDENDVVLSSGDLPVSASFNPITGAYSWTPYFNQAGNYSVTFFAVDDGAPVETIPYELPLPNPRHYNHGHLFLLFFF